MRLARLIAVLASATLHPGQAALLTELPPESKLSDGQTALPGTEKASAAAAQDGLAPDDAALADYLQVWLRADILPLKDSAQVFRWPDSSGHHRDAAPTLGVFNGTGLPPTFVKTSAINGRPAVRFETNTALATPGERPLAIEGDAAYSMFVVANLKAKWNSNEPSVIVGFGELMDSSNASPDRPAAGLLQIDGKPVEKQRLDHAGGFGRDAGLGRPGSFAPFYEMPLIISLIKRPGPMGNSSSIFINGEPADDWPASGVSAAPDIRQRRDFSLILGHAVEQSGSIVGDVAEVIVYNTALSTVDRQKIEKTLSAKYGIIILDPLGDLVAEPVNEKARQHWAFRKPVRPLSPLVKGKHKIRTPIDEFILAKLEEKNIDLSSTANGVTLLRRAYLDLTGLPPSPEQVEEYVKDESPTAYEKLLEQLLASPRFGERWGRHWLDMAGYVDVTGNDQNAEQTILSATKWKYRDYVIRAFNQDKPFNQFLVEQLAGDELVDWRNAEQFSPEIKDLLIATGYLRTAIDDTHEVDLNKPAFRYQVGFDTVQIMGNSLLGLTIQCCRCHDHKYDPLTQKDYYRLLSLFTPALNPAAWLQPKDRELADVSPAKKAQLDKHNAEIEQQLKPIEEKVTAVRAKAKQQLFASRLESVPEADRAEAKIAFETPAEKRNDSQKELVKKFDSQLNISTNDVQKALNPADRAQIETFELQWDHLNRQRTNYGTIRAFFESGPPPRGYAFLRGDFQHPRARVNPGFIEVLCRSGDGVTMLKQLNSQGMSTGRRLAFARWLINTNEHAAGLVARVWMNRVWQQLFGEGLVATPDNFGIAGLPPTHPELLEWLATEFIDSGWCVKPMIKKMMMSHVYRQSSSPTPLSRTVGLSAASDPMRVDPDNRLLWHMRLRRLESEIIRDSILAVSGKLDLQMGGPPVTLVTAPDGSCSIAPDDKLPTPTSKWRRTIYLMSRRNFHLPILSSFDQPTINTTCTRRMSSSAVSQPLTLLNDSFLIEQSSYFAERIARKAGSAKPGCVEMVFEVALGRKPMPEELAWSLAFLEDQAKNHRAANTPAEKSDHEALVNLCQMILNTSECLYQN